MNQGMLVKLESTKKKQWQWKQEQLAWEENRDAARLVGHIFPNEQHRQASNNKQGEGRGI